MQFFKLLNALNIDDGPFCSRLFRDVAVYAEPELK